MHICLIFIIGARSITLFIQRELGRWWWCWGGEGRRVSPCAHLLNIHNCCKKYRIIYSEGVGEVVVVFGEGGGGVERE